MVLPSLILRLEHLAQPDATRVRGAEPKPEAAYGGQAAPVEAGSPLETADLPETAASPDLPAGSETTMPPTTARRVVDVSGSERLSTATPLSRWSAAVAAAHDACFVLDLNGVVISISVAGVELLGSGDVAMIGKHILEVINLVDLETGALNPAYAPRITPLVVLDGPGLARSLMRVRHDSGTVVTLDSSSVPIHDVNANLLGSVTFLAPIQSR
jgi:PAS domain-containing protein